MSHSTPVTSSSRWKLPALPRGRTFWWGLALAAALGVLGMAAAELPWARHLGFSALPLAIVLGMIAGNSIFPAVSAYTAAGVDFSKSTLLRTGIVLFGLRITFQQIAAVGLHGVAIDALMVTLTFVLAVLIGTRLMKLDRQTAMLIGAGSAVCGAAAVLATEPVVRAQAHKVSVAVATVVVFGTLSMFVYPVLYPHLGLSEQAFGIFAGSTIHEVAQVVAAGKSVSDAAAATAVIEKMLRVMMLAPLLLVLSSVQRKHAAAGAAHAGTRLPIPWFALLFIAVCAFNSLNLLPALWVQNLVQLDTLLLASAMAALGLRTHVGAIRQAGLRPLLLAAALFAFLCAGGYEINRLVTYALV